MFVISAPSGAGKTTLCKEIIDFFQSLRHSVSYTTRPQRPGEQDGIDYHFVTRTVFDAMVAQGAFAEWAEVHGNRYGTAIETLERFRAEGRDVLLDIDCQGARQLKRSYREGVFIFVLPPSLTELQRRLHGRNTDSPEVIARRIANARDEIREAVWYDYLVINDDFSQAFSELKSIVLAEGCRTSRRQAKISRILESK
ncbi:MAG TPA: guanylate kinase [Desulfuromonadales bacterium]|nr:guanylate kinase [Desulfuromonadales bacterium]